MNRMITNGAVSSHMDTSLIKISEKEQARQKNQIDNYQLNSMKQMCKTHPLDFFY